MGPRRETDAEIPDDSRAQRRRKYLSLGVGELAAAATFCVVTFGFLAPRLDGSARPALWSALVPLLAVLVQAGIYWLLARMWVKRSVMPPAVAVTYRALRVGNVVLLAAGLVGVLLWWPDQAIVALFVMAVWVFGAAEYVNYFHVRLSYPVGEWFTTVGQWRAPRLVQDLRSAATGQNRH